MLLIADYHSSIKESEGQFEPQVLPWLDIVSGRGEPVRRLSSLSYAGDMFLTVSLCACTRAPPHPVLLHNRGSESPYFVPVSGCT